MELPADKDALAQKVKEELVAMSLLESIDAVTSTHIRYPGRITKIKPEGCSGAITFTSCYG